MAPLLTLGTYLQLVVLWLLLLMVLSVPTVLYAMSKTLPSDNILGLSEGSLLAFNEIAVVAVYIIIVAILPALAQCLVESDSE